MNGSKREEIASDFMIKMILVLALVAGMIMISGCAASDGSGSQAGNPPSNDNNYGAAQNDGAGTPGFGNRSGMMRNGSGMGGRGGFGNGNITDAQRQQMMQAWAAACDGKTTGDTCSVAQGARGSMNGTCGNRNGTLSCTPSGMGGRNGTRGGFGQPLQNP